MRPAHALTEQEAGGSTSLSLLSLRRLAGDKFHHRLPYTSRGAGAGEGAGEGAESPVPGSVEGVGVGCEGAPASGD